MPALVAGIHVFGPAWQDVDGRVKPGHDDGVCALYSPNTALVMMLRWISLEPP